MNPPLPARPVQAPSIVAPLILAVDTTHEFGSLALVSGEETVEEVLMHAPAGFGHVLYPELERLLGRDLSQWYGKKAARN